jgi:hypothetical protein
MVDPPLRQMFILFLSHNSLHMSSGVSQCITLCITVMYIHIYLMSPQFDMSRPQKCTFSLFLNDASIISRKCTFMWLWQVKLWTYQVNMYVHHSNTESNTLKNTGTHMKNCYGQETRWTSSGAVNRPRARLFSYSCVYKQLCVYT